MSGNVPVAQNENSTISKRKEVFVTTSNTTSPANEIGTGIPVFIGYTQKNVSSVPKKINSMKEFRDHFGGKQMLKFEIPTDLSNFKKEDVTISGVRFYLYESLELYFKNGGRDCYIVSVGNYFDVVNKNDLSKPLQVGAELSNLKEANLIAIPDALALNQIDCYHTYQMVLQHCNRMKNRFAIFDIHDGFDVNTLQRDVSDFRNNVGTQNLNRGAVYYPWVETSSISISEVGPHYFLGGLGDLKNIIKSMAAPQKEAAQSLLFNFFPNGSTGGMDTNEVYKKGIQLSQQLQQLDANYKLMTETVAQKINLLPTAAMLAGVYVANDLESGVWKAPANIGLNAVIKPSVSIDNDQQAGLNVSATDGKSINAIRFFNGRGTLIWGARTLEGNSLDWKYINVRRFMSMLEASLESIMIQYSFQPNDQNTWLRLKSESEMFLEGLFRQGALQGSKKEDAYSVKIGLGESMTVGDINNGKMIMHISVSPLRPAEFIVITLQQDME